MTEAAEELINAYVVEGHALLLTNAPSDGTAVEETKSDQQFKIVKRVVLEENEWNALKHTLKVNGPVAAILLSPTGKVLASSLNLAEVEKEAERFETCVALAVSESTLEAAPVRRTADEWIQTHGERDDSPFNIFKKQREDAATTSEAQNARGSPAHAQPHSSTTATSLDPAKANAESKIKSSTASVPSAIPSVTPSESKATAASHSKSTKVAIKFSNGAPRQIVDIADCQSTTFADLLKRIGNDQITTLTQEYPRRVYTLAEHGSKTLDELSLNANPSLLASMSGTFRRGEVQGQHQSIPGLIWSFILTWITRLIEFVKSAFNQQALPPATPAPRQRPGIRGSSAQATAPNEEGERKKPNQYWNGDSTVFQSPDDPSD